MQPPLWLRLGIAWIDAINPLLERSEHSGTSLRTAVATVIVTLSQLLTSDVTKSPQRSVAGFLNLPGTG